MWKIWKLEPTFWRNQKIWCTKSCFSLSNERYAKNFCCNVVNELCVTGECSNCSNQDMTIVGEIEETTFYQWGKDPSQKYCTIILILKFWSFLILDLPQQKCNGFCQRLIINFIRILKKLSRKMKLWFMLSFERIMAKATAWNPKCLLCLPTLFSFIVVTYNNSGLRNTIVTPDKDHSYDALYHLN